MSAIWINIFYGLLWFQTGKAHTAIMHATSSIKKILHEVLPVKNKLLVMFGIKNEAKNTE
jgi:hypothetical protein